LFFSIIMVANYYLLYLGCHLQKKLDFHPFPSSKERDRKSGNFSKKKSLKIKLFFIICKLAKIKLRVTIFPFLIINRPRMALTGPDTFEGEDWLYFITVLNAEIAESRNRRNRENREKAKVIGRHSQLPARWLASLVQWYCRWL